MICCGWTDLNIAKYSHLLFTIPLVEGCRLFSDSLVSGWAPFERKGSGCWREECSQSHGATVFVFISESAYWSSATDAYSHFNTLTIHPLKITRIKARLLRSLNNSQCMTSEETTQTSVIKNFIISNKNRWAPYLFSPVNASEWHSLWPVA